MAAESARTLVRKQRVRNRIFIAVAAAAAILDAGIVVVLAAAGTRAVIGAIAAGVAVTLFAAISLIHAIWSPGSVRCRPPGDEETAVLGPIAERLAERLGVETPVICIVADDAVNAFSVYSGQRAALFYTEGFLAEFSLVSQRPQIEAVTAHLLARASAGDNALTVAANGLLNWALFLFSAVVAGFAYILGQFGVAFLTSDAHKRLKPGPPPYDDDMVNRLIVWGDLGLHRLVAAHGGRCRRAARRDPGSRGRERPAGPDQATGADRRLDRRPGD